MRLLAFLAAIAVLFALSDASAAQPAYAVTVASAELPQGPSARAAGLRMLTWPGKVEPGRPRVQVRTASAPQPTALRPPRYWDPAQPQVQPVSPPRPAALPNNIYAPAPPRVLAAAQLPAPAARAAAPVASSSEDNYQPTHFYSVHRQYGQAPDPIPLSAQFFASSTPDLAQPPPPVPRTVTTSTGRVVQSAPPSPDDNPG